MSATEMEDAGVPLPRISEIRALPDFRLSIVWAEGMRTGRADTVDLAPVINTYKLYRLLRNDEDLFQTARLDDDGNVVAWGDGTIDMSAELIEEIANEAMTPEDFVSFLRRNHLTPEAAAALLGYSRRQIGNFSSTGPIPRVVALACYGYEARIGADKERQPLPEAMSSIHEHATEEAHAMLLRTARNFTDQLREVSSDMRRELEATCAELRKNILELPQGTADAAQHFTDQLQGMSSDMRRELEATRAELRKSILELPHETGDAAQHFTDQLQEMSSDIRRELEATSAELRKSIFELPHETADAAQRFAYQLQEMSSDMRRELEATRAELHKSILRLPHETADAVQHLRRVIVDQVEALAELNRIVARQGPGLDIVEPTEPRMEPAEPPPRRDVAREAPPRRDVAREAPPRRDVARETPPRRDVARETHAPALQSAKARGKRAGWLSDLLTRASQDDLPAAADREPPPEAARLESHAIESLDSIAVDIARMIDHDAAAELWDRYQRGERNVFTRNLYTMQDERTFDEVRRKYHSDREFMQTVDRYIAEFERLLDEVSRDDRGQVVARSYLRSETGKVYTMLALAAGRLD